MKEEMNFESFEAKGINKENFVVRKYSDGRFEVEDLDMSNILGYRYIMPYAVFETP